MSYNNYQQDQLAGQFNQMNLGAQAHTPLPANPKTSTTRRKRDQHVFLNLSANEPVAPNKLNQFSHFQEHDENFDPNAAASSAGIHGPIHNIPTMGKASSPYPYPAPDAQFIPPQQSSPSLAAARYTASPKNVPQDRFNYLEQQQQAINAYQPQQQQLQPQMQQLDNDQVMTVPGLRKFNEDNYKRNEYLTFENVFPPAAGTQFKAVDQGIASPNFARMTLYSIPATEQLRASSKIPLGMLIRPFGEESVPQVDLRTASAVPRCGRCRAYLNPGMSHTTYTMTCNFCSFTSKVPEEYISDVDMSGMRTIASEKPELQKGVVDFLVPDSYNLDEKAPKPLHYVFLLDVSDQSVKLKLSDAVCNAIEGLLYDSETLAPGSKISIIAFDTRLHFFNLSPDLEQANVSTVSDVDDPFLPFFDGMFADPTESANAISTTLRHIEQGNEFINAPECAYGAALLAAKLLLEQVGGGEVISFLSCLPTWGPGALALKNPTGKSAVEFEKEVLTADNKFYSDLVKEYTKASIGLHLIVATRTPVNLMNVGIVAHKTGGSVKLWNTFDVNRDEANLFQAVKNAVRQSQGYQGQLKVRCSAGLQVKRYYGPIDEVTSGAPTVPLLHGDTSIICDFEYDGKLNTKKDAHFQAALLYTSRDGIRKVRVINSILSVTESISGVFNFADQDSILAYLLRQDLARIPSSNLVSLRSTMSAQLSDIIASYKSQVAANNSLPDQLVMPNGLRTLPTFFLAALKSKLLKPLVSNPDLRVESFFNLQSFPASRLSVYLYPLLVSLHGLNEEDCTFDKTTGRFNMPNTVLLSQEFLQEGGAFLAFNSKQLMIILHNNVNPLFLEDLFGKGIKTLNELNPEISALPQLDTHISSQVRNLCLYLAQNYNHATDPFPVRIVRVGLDNLDFAEFREMLYEDRSEEYKMSTGDYLRQLHKMVGDKDKHGGNTGAGGGDGSSIGQRFHVF